MDDLIQTLVNDLAPRPALTAQRLWKHSAVYLFMAGVIILSILGLRTDYVAAMQTGAMFWKPAMFFMAWLGTLLIIPAVARPGQKPKGAYYLFFAAAIAIFGFAVAQQYNSGFNVDITADASPYFCISIIGLGGLMAMLLAWCYWIGKAAPENPALLGLLAGLSAGFLVATAYSLHCDHDAALYILVFYLPPIALLGIGGALAGKKLLQW